LFFQATGLEKDMNIYVGGLSEETTGEDLRQIFEAFGQVASTAIIKDKMTGVSRGFGFVEMPSKKEAEDAINNIREIKGRMVTVNEARPKEDRGGRSGGGYGGGRGGSRRRDSRGGGGGYGDRKGGRRY
jgi:RNA recognition motif-containing protein